MIAETSRLNIRQLSVSDAAFVLGLTNEPSTIENIGDKGLRSVADAEQFISNGPWTRQQRPGYGQFALELKHSGELIGVCGILYRVKLDLTDVGFALMPKFWRQGFAFEAARAVMDYGHSVLAVENIVGLTSGTNVASINLLKKLGMQFETMVSLSDDGVADIHVYSEFHFDSTTGKESSAG
ncbi:MAG: GNAT family N-acetyltransferase [Xanthomonadales bacterium]|nr:GNAT family N-acetyltransferase [Xanthomonadales bacterium]